MLLRVITGYGVCATNEYHTSGEAALPQKALIIPVLVAPDSVPNVLLQVIDDVNGAMGLQVLLGGATSVIQILNCHCATVPATLAMAEYTRTRYVWPGTTVGANTSVVVHNSELAFNVATVQFVVLNIWIRLFVFISVP